MLSFIYADEKGEIFEDKSLASIGNSGYNFEVLSKENTIPSPPSSLIYLLPKRYALTYSPNLKNLVKTKFIPLSSVLPPNYIRTHLPGYISNKSSFLLPPYAYTAVGMKNYRFYSSAIRIDYSPLWDAKKRPDKKFLIKKIKEKIRKFPNNRLLYHLKNCSLNYNCWTAQNLFLGYGEAGIPISSKCNANCLSCISLHNRIGFLPNVDEILQIAIPHLRFNKKSIISFGQGCEGEPSLHYKIIKDIILKIRHKTDNGTININTNGSNPEVIEELCKVGLNSIRVSLNSAVRKNYIKYFKPEDYKFEDVINSIIKAKNYGLFVSINLLVFPGFNDREDEIDALFKFIERTRIDMVQLRNLDIDPNIYLKSFLNKKCNTIGIRKFISLMKKSFPKVVIGSFNRAIYL